MTNIPHSLWTVAQGTVEDRPLFVRVNTAAAALIGNVALRHRIGVAIPLLTPTDDGLPNAAESARLHEIEYALCAAFDDGGSTVHLLVITTSGIREFVFHTSDPHHVDRSIAAIRAQFPEHEVQLIIEDDPEWDVYQHFAGAL